MKTPLSRISELQNTSQHFQGHLKLIPFRWSINLYRLTKKVHMHHDQCWYFSVIRTILVSNSEDLRFYELVLSLSRSLQEKMFVQVFLRSECLNSSR